MQIPTFPVSENPTGYARNGKTPTAQAVWGTKEEQTEEGGKEQKKERER